MGPPNMVGGVIRAWCTLISLYKLVKEDRKSPQAAAMKKKFLEYAIYYACNSKQTSKANKAVKAIGELAKVQ